MIGISVQQYDILPNNKEHIGAYIEYQDIQELRDGFVEELSDTIVDWIYSSEKYEEIKKKLVNSGKSEAAASQYIGRKAKNKFRANKNSENVLIQGQMGELLLYHFIQKCMKAVPLLRKMNIATFMIDGDHSRYKVEDWLMGMLTGVGGRVLVLNDMNKKKNKLRLEWSDTLRLSLEIDGQELYSQEEEKEKANELLTKISRKEQGYESYLDLLEEKDTS